MKNYDYALQQNSYDCGIASLLTVFMYYGLKPSREELVNKIKKKNGGYTAYDLIKLSKQYGIESYGIKSTIEKINTVPLIAHTIQNKNLFHFIVILEINKQKQRLKVMDPSLGIITMSFKEFNDITTNIFLVFKGKRKKKAKNKRFKKEIKNVFKNNKKTIFQSLFLSIIFVLLSLLFNYYLKLILISKKLSILIFITIIFIAITIFKNTFNYLKNKLVLKLNVKIDKEITNKIINHIFKLPYKYFIEKESGELVTIIEDVENFKEIITKIFILSSVDLILITIVIIYLGILNLYVSIFIILILFALFIITKKYQYLFNDSYIKFKNKKINYNASLINHLTSFETIKNLNISEQISTSINKKYNDTLIYDKTYNEKNNTYNFIIGLFIDIFYILYIFLSSYLVIKTNIGLFDIVLFSSMFYTAIGLINNINESILMYKVYESSIDRVLDCLEKEEEFFPPTNYNSINKISFENLTFKQEEKTILNKINLSISKGEKIYLTGESGIGKSTLIKLLLRYYEPEEGKIKIDNIDIKDLDLTFLRNSITYIGQNENLFTGSIKDNMNIVSGDKEKIDKVSKITLLKEFLEKNMIDYNYFLEESGFNLSGGERKKIILTRGLLKMKNVLILDEVFNEISIEEERKILNNIFDNYKDKIIILISHRDNNRDLFDKKYKLIGEGDIVEIK